MRRPHRSIETFDISLMAVVTKAMGAFLVLMLLLMPYYSSSPMGQDTANDLAGKIEKVKKDVQEVRERLQGASNEDLRKLLADALAQLDEARKLIDELKRMNDALNAQVKRLEGENDSLKGQVAQLQQQIDMLQGEVAQLRRQIDAKDAQIAALAAEVEMLRKENQALKEQLAQLNGGIIALQLINWDCPDNGLSIGLWVPGTYISIGGGAEKVPYVLDSEEPSLGDGFWKSDLSLRELPSQRDVEIGHSARFNSAWALYRGATARDYAIVVAGRGEKAEQAPDGHKIVALKKMTADCTLLISIQVKLPQSGAFATFYPQQTKIEKGAYAVLLGELALTGSDVKWKDPPDEQNVAWFNDQLEHARKE